MNSIPLESEKELAAKRSLEYIQDGMTIGLGSGSTSEYFLHFLADHIQKNKMHIKGIPTSERTKEIAQSLKIPLIRLEEVNSVDITVDGADEVDFHFNLLKGGHGALLREKVLAWASKEIIIIVDSSKVVQTLGQFPLPVEVVPFAWFQVTNEITSFCQKVSRRQTPDDEPFLTDQGNYIIDCSFGSIKHPRKVASRLSDIPGVVEHGLFINMTLKTKVIVGRNQTTEILTIQ